MSLFIYVFFLYENIFKVLQIDVPWKLISLLGWMIWPRNGRNTNGIFSDDDPLTNGANVHSVDEEAKKIIIIHSNETDGLSIVFMRPFECTLIHFRPNLSEHLHLL